jgi:tetratricopeptide (TPR) repeat protein
MSSLNNKPAMFVLLLMATMLSSGQVLGKESVCGKQRGVSAKPLDEIVWKKMNDAYEDVGNELYDEAYRKLQIISNRAHDDYLRAVTAQALAQVEWARSNYDSALSYFEKAVDLDALPDQPHFSLMYQIAQLYYMKERYDDALDKLELWMCKVAPEKVTANAWVLKAYIYAQKEDWKNIITSIETAISMSEDPKQGWYQLKLISHYELEQFPKVAQTLEIMIQKWPDKKDYWTQLSQIYFRLKRDDEALSVMALAYRRNMLDTQADIKYLSNLYSDRDVPFKAAEVLQKGIEDGIVEDTSKNWAMIADTWYAAEELEKALFAYENAGKASVDGKIDLRRAYILVDMERWKDAAEALELVLSKGGVNERKTGEAHVLQGMSEFNLGNYDKASTAWGRASKYPKAKKSAKQWMNHMREERARKSS